MKKLLTVFIAFSLLLGTFSGLCLTAGAENTGESPNLLEMYGFNPNFDDGISPWTFDSATGEQCDEDSADDDGYCVKVTSRKNAYSVPRLARLIEIVQEQGEGRYYYSFYVKCAKKVAEKHLDNMSKVAKVAKDGYMSVMPLATLGYNTEPRIENPVTWITGENSLNGLPYSGYTADDPTAQEVTESVLDVLNFNKENAKYFRTNTVLIYCWNEFDEGGWFCPTIKVDEKGNAIKNADGSNQVNREYLDAVKKAIELYREKEAEAAIFDAEGNKIKDIELSTPQVSETTAPTSTNAPSTTDTPDADAPQQEEGDGNGWVLWAIIGGAVVVAAAAAVVVVIVLKKKKIAQNTK